MHIALQLGNVLIYKAVRVFDGTVKSHGIWNQKNLNSNSSSNLQCHSVMSKLKTGTRCRGSTEEELVKHQEGFL